MQCSVLLRTGQCVGVKHFICSELNNSASTTQTPTLATEHPPHPPEIPPAKVHPCLTLLPAAAFGCWDWLLCFFPLCRLAEMENRNGSYLNDSISPNESMWEPLFLFFPPSLPPIDQLAVCELALSSLFPLAGCDDRSWRVISVTVVPECVTLHKKLTPLCCMFWWWDLIFSDLLDLGGGGGQLTEMTLRQSKHSIHAKWNIPLPMLAPKLTA